MKRLLKSLPRRRRTLLLALPVAAILVWAFLPVDSLAHAPRFYLDLTSALGIKSSGDVLRYVDPLIGTVNGGHVFPGPTLPYGMAKPVADVDNRGEAAAGFVSDDSRVLGFSHLHDSGTGGSPSLGNFPLFPHPGCPEDDYTRCKYTSAQRATKRIEGSAEARVGYFSIGLNNSVRAEMTATQHAALYRFNFPSTAEVYSDGSVVPNSPLILLDLVDLGNTRSGGDIEVDAASGRIKGGGRFRPSFGTGQYEAFFCADFAGAEIRDTGTFLHTNATNETKALGNVGSGFAIPSGSAGAWVHFARAPRDRIMARVGVSFMSAEQACASAERELPDFDFGRAVRDVEAAWREKLAAVQPDQGGLGSDLLTTFWSGLYRSMLSPQDYTGENPLWASDEPYFDSFYCIWDSFRAQHPLLTVVDPAAQARMVRSLLDTYKHEGKLPDCRMSFSKGYTQGGSNADVVLADAFVKNLTGSIDWALAYEAVVSDAEVEPRDWSVQGRGGLESWHRLGYIPFDDEDRNGTGPMSRSVSRTVEYAYDDFAVAQMARGGLGTAADASKYLARARNWRNVFNAEQADQYRDAAGRAVVGFRGFAQPRYRNGTWRFQDPRLCSPVHEPHRCYLDTRYDTYEGSPWLYTFYVPQDMAGLAAALGGRRALVDRLDFFHEHGISYMGNEPNFLPTYQFHYGGRPGRSAYWVHRYVPAQFNSSLAGIPGNDDCAMGAFAAFAFMGFFPVAGQDVYLLTPPLFRSVSLRTPAFASSSSSSSSSRTDGAVATIRNRNFDPTYKRIYIQSARLNGEPYTKSWITHDFFVGGGTLEFVLGEEESDWGTREEDLPPSLSTSADWEGGV
ncbi:glycoside hydrolase family 92 protein [Biscogniauxia sp. FL1348]|nr:glycoside hydrolase family 92 protein [Biscogniauxia sp. FL1348]